VRAPGAQPRRRRGEQVGGGSDGPVTGLWPGLGAPALARGYNALVFDGPGQQSMLFERHVPFRPDWEHVITPVVDILEKRPEVDAGRVALAGSRDSVPGSRPEPRCGSLRTPNGVSMRVCSSIPTAT